MKHIAAILSVAGSILCTALLSTNSLAQEEDLAAKNAAQANGKYATVEVVVRPLFQRAEWVKKVYETYDERMLLTQSVMDHVKYRLGNKLIAGSLFNSRLPLEIKFELVRFDIVSDVEMIDPVDQERYGMGGEFHAIATAKLTFDKDGKIFKRRYKLTKENGLKYTSNAKTNKELLANALDGLIEMAFSDEELVEFLQA